MEHPESVTAVLTDNEPPDGTKLILRNGSDWQIIRRDDDAAVLRGAHTDAVYALGEPMAVFRR
jgi:hypothetical protein